MFFKKVNPPLSQKSIKKVISTGSITIELIVLLGFIAALTPILYNQVSERRKDIENINEANKLLLLKNATQEYIETNKDNINTGSIVISPEEVGIDISGYQIGIRKNADGTLDAMIVPNVSSTDLNAGKIASLIGVSAGVYSEQDKSKVWGINGIWAEDISNYGFSSLPTGIPVITTAYDKENSDGINEEQLKEIIENTSFTKLSADEICLNGKCISEWEDTTYNSLQTIINCNSGDTKACNKGFQKGINTSCANIALAYKENDSIALTGFYTIAIGEDNFLYNQPCVFKDGEVASNGEVHSQCNTSATGSSAACQYAWINNLNRSCANIVSSNPDAPSQYYYINSSQTVASRTPCYFVNKREATAAETIVQCNTATTSSAMNSNIACRYGYVKGYNTSCSTLISKYPAGSGQTNSITTSSGGNRECCSCCNVSVGYTTDLSSPFTYPSGCPRGKFKLEVRGSYDCDYCSSCSNSGKLTVTGYFNGGTTFAAKIVTRNSYGVLGTARGITANGVVVAAAGSGGCCRLNGRYRSVSGASIGASSYGAGGSVPSSQCNGYGVWGGKGTCEPSAYTCQNGTASADIKLTLISR